MTNFAVGDNGQQFEVTCLMDGKRITFGWSNDQGGVDAMLRSIELHPSMSEGQVFDRHAPDGERAPHEPPAEAPKAKKPKAKA